MKGPVALPTFTTHPECSLIGERFPADRPAGLSPAGRPLLVRYDPEGLERSLDRDVLALPGCQKPESNPESS